MSPVQIFMAALMFNVQQHALTSLTEALDDKVSRMMKGEDVDNEITLTWKASLPEGMLKDLSDDMLEHYASEPEVTSAVDTLKTLWDEEV